MPVKIHGKDYVTVHERVGILRDEEGKDKNYCIVTDLIEHTDKICIFKAAVYKDSDSLRPLATGHAHERITDNPVNRLAMLENAETSAIGRALAFMGLAIDGGIASAEEMNKIDRHKKEPEKYTATQEQKLAFTRIIMSKGLDDKLLVTKIHTELKESDVVYNTINLTKFIEERI